MVRGKLQANKKTTEIAPGFHLIMLKGPWGVDLDVMEISLAIETAEGVVLIVGCSHPTLEKIVQDVSERLNKPIKLVLGGTHLLPAPPKEINRIASALLDKWKVAWLAPVHCTGEPAFAILQKRYGKNYVYAGLGTTVVVGPEVMTRADADNQKSPIKFAMDDTDRASYREMVRKNLYGPLLGGGKTKVTYSHSSR